MGETHGSLFEDEPNKSGACGDGGYCKGQPDFHKLHKFDVMALFFDDSHSDDVGGSADRRDIAAYACTDEQAEIEDIGTCSDVLSK